MSKITPKVLAVASGKGGVGKTLLAACLATILGERERYKGKTLLVDLDFGVKGLTFLTGSVNDWKDHVGSMTDVLTGGDPELALKNAKSVGGIRIVPSDTDFTRQFNRDTFLQDDTVMEQRLRGFVSVAEKSGHQIVIFDTGAGIDFTVLALARVVDSTIIVVEPDEISQSAALDLHGELRRKARNLHFVINKMPKLGENTGHVAKGIKFLPSLPFDYKMQVKFVRNARSILYSGFRGMRYRRYVGGIARELYGVNAMMPTWWDSVAERTATRVLIRFFGYGSLFLLAVVAALVVIAQFFA